MMIRNSQNTGVPLKIFQTSFGLDSRLSRAVIFIGIYWENLLHFGAGNSSKEMMYTFIK